MREVPSEIVAWPVNAEHAKCAVAQHTNSRHAYDTIVSVGLRRLESSVFVGSIYALLKHKPFADNTSHSLS